jgi:hypothetical protein
VGPRLGVAGVAAEHDGGEITVLEHRVHDPAKVRPHLGERFSVGRIEGDLADTVANQRQERRRQLREYVALAGEVQVERAPRDLGRVDDVVHGRRVIALVLEHLGGRRDDRAASLLPPRLGPHGPSIGLFGDFAPTRGRVSASCSVAPNCAGLEPSRRRRRALGRLEGAGIALSARLRARVTPQWLARSGLTVAVDSQSRRSLP